MIPGFGLLYDHLGQLWCNSFVIGHTEDEPDERGWYLVGPVESGAIYQRGVVVLMALWAHLNPMGPRDGGQ